MGSRRSADFDLNHVLLCAARLCHSKLGREGKFTSFCLYHTVFDSAYFKAFSASDTFRRWHGYQPYSCDVISSSVDDFNCATLDECGHAIACLEHISASVSGVLRSLFSAMVRHCFKRFNTLFLSFSTTNRCSI